VSDGYLGDPEKVVLVEGAADAIARARALGFATVVVSNQSGVARGMFGEDDVRAVNHRIDELLLACNPVAVIDRHEYCPFLPDASVERYRQDSDLRKPKPGMLFSAAEKLALDLSRSWLIGDAPRDIEAGKAAGCKTVLLQLPNLPPSPATEATPGAAPDFTVASLREALDCVEKDLQPPAPAQQPPSESRPSQPAATQPVPSEPAPPEPAAKEPVPSVPVPGVPVTPPAGADTARLERLAEQILIELRKRSEETDYSDFSVSKLMAGISQVMTLALVFMSYLNRGDFNSFQMLILFAIFLQVLTIALLIMGKQK
jgi:D,D-heptose 1,7-bisphosphate phosphatase